MKCLLTAAVAACLLTAIPATAATASKEDAAKAETAKADAKAKKEAEEAEARAKKEAEEAEARDKQEAKEAEVRALKEAERQADIEKKTAALRARGFVEPLSPELAVKLLGDFETHVITSYARANGTAGATAVLVLDHPAGRFHCERQTATIAVADADGQHQTSVGPVWAGYQCWPFPGFAVDPKKFEPKPEEPPVPAKDAKPSK